MGARGGWHPASSCKVGNRKSQTGFRNARIRTCIRITGRTRSRVLFTSQSWTKKARPSQFPSFKLWCVWHGIPSWPILGHLFCLPLPASTTCYDSSLEELKRSVSDLACYSNNYNHGPFPALNSIPTFSSIKP